MEEQVTPKESTVESPPNMKKRGRYRWWIRATALILVFATLMSITSVDFSIMRYEGTDQMVAAQYLLDSTPYLGQSRLQRLRSLLTDVDAYSINLQAAEIAISKTDYERAAKFLNKCIPNSPDESQKAELYNRLGCVYMLIESPAEAQQAFDSSIVLDADKPTPYLLRSQLRYQNGDETGAALDAAAYLARGGSDVEMLSTASSICELAGDMENAVEAMNRMIEGASTDTQKAHGRAERGRLFYLQGMEEQAAKDITAAKNMDPSVLLGVHYAIIGLYEYNAGDYINGREDFLKAARLSEDGNAEYYEQAILCGYLSEDFAFIKKAVAEAKEQNLMTANSLLIDGILLFSEENYEESIDALSASIDTGKIVVGVYYYRGLSLLALGKFAEAAVDFTEALNWEEDKLSCIFNRGICYYALDDMEKAVADLLVVAYNETDEALAASAKELLNSLEVVEESTSEP